MHSGWYAGLVEFSLPLNLQADNNLSGVHQNNTNGALKPCWVNQNGSQCRHPTALLKQPTRKCMTFFPPFTPFTRTEQWASGCRFPHTRHYKRGARMNDMVLAENYAEEMNAPPARIMDGSVWHHWFGAVGDILLPTCPNWVSPAPRYWGSTREPSEKQESHSHTISIQSWYWRAVSKQLLGQEACLTNLQANRSITSKSKVNKESSLPDLPQRTE